jgi:DNA-cytosine methyltransferase
MTHASLFSGIGGFDLAAEWAGWTNLFNCEIDPFCQKVLKYHFPNAEQYADIRTTDFTVWRGRVDVLTGGFPCQPFSTSGKRRGTEDDRYMWPEMLRAIQQIKPEWVVPENVCGIINWSGGLVFEQVCADLEAEGYDVLPLVLPVAGVDGWIERQRVFFVAHAKSSRLPSTPIQQEASVVSQSKCYFEWASLQTIISHDFRSESNKHGIIDGIPVGLDECSIHAYGNAVSPFLVYQIFQTIDQLCQNL